MKNQDSKKEENVFVFCAHNDDQVIGCGGTLVKYAKEGKNFYTYIFSYGESSHPHYNRKAIVETRVVESQKCDKVMGGSGVIYYGLKEGKFKEEFKNKDLKKSVTRVIKEKKPTKIFTHSIDDPHPDHQAVLKIILDYFYFFLYNLAKIRKCL